MARNADGRLILLQAPLALVPGEEVEAEVVWRARHGDGLVTRWLQEDERRIAPACPYTTRCGGCSLWGVDHRLRGELKHAMAADLLRRMLPGAPDWDWLPAPADALRERIQLHWNGEHLGYHAYHSHALVPVAACPISVPELSAAVPLLNAALKAEVLPAAPARWELATGTPAGDVRASGGGKTWRFINNDYAAAASCRRPNLADAGTRLPLDPVEDDSPLLHHLGTAILQQHPRAFFQVCADWAWQAFAQVCRGWQLAGATLFDLYGGGGFFSRLLTEHYRQFVLVESSPLSAADARVNLAGLLATVQQADVATWLAAQSADWAASADTILLDPPRAGLPPLVSRALANCGADRIVLVGCDGATFCRDVRRICGGGRWQLAKLAVIDLFPNTPGAECVGLLSRDAG